MQKIQISLVAIPLQGRAGRQRDQQQSQAASGACWLCLAQLQAAWFVPETFVGLLLTEHSHRQQRVRMAYTRKGSLLTSLNQSMRGTLVAPISFTNSIPAGRPAQSLSVCTHRQTHTKMCRNKQTYTDTYTYTYRRLQTRANADRHTIHAHKHTRAHSFTCWHIQTHVGTQLHMQGRTETRTPIQTYAVTWCMSCKVGWQKLVDIMSAATAASLSAIQPTKQHSACIEPHFPSYTCTTYTSHSTQTSKGHRLYQLHVQSQSLPW